MRAIFSMTTINTECCYKSVVMLGVIQLSVACACNFFIVMLNVLGAYCNIFIVILGLIKLSVAYADCNIFNYYAQSHIDESPSC
jgi:hypothetical protein